MKWFKRILLLLLIIIGITVYFNYPKLNMISGYASKYMASQVFLAQRPAASVIASDLNAPLIEYASTEVLRDEKTAKANVHGLLERKAVYREGLGAVLTNEDFDATATYLQPERQMRFDSVAYPFGHLPPKDSIFTEIDYEQLKKAVSLAFANNDVQKTRTLLVLYKGHLIHENYIEGFNKDTRILGWSMTKSILATCYGVLQHQGKLSMNDRASIVEWQNDERKNITLNHLLRMQSSLEWEEVYTKISDVTKMLFLDSDMTLAQKQKEMIAEPGAIWNYSSGTSNLLSGILRKQFDSHQEYLNFPYQALLDKIGAHSFLIEVDMAGNYVGSSYAWANTRDWGKLGQLYLDNGKWNGTQLFTKKWVDYITTPTEHSDGAYGAHFWLNSEGFYPDAPRDLYSMNGYEGQYVFIIPSKDLVIVRTGLGENPDFNVNRFLSTLVKAVR